MGNKIFKEFELNDLKNIIFDPYSFDLKFKNIVKSKDNTAEICLFGNKDKNRFEISKKSNILMFNQEIKTMNNEIAFNSYYFELFKKIENSNKSNLFFQYIVSK